MGAHASAGCLHVMPFLNMKSALDIERMQGISAATAELVGRYLEEGVSRLDGCLQLDGLAPAVLYVRIGAEPSDDASLCISHRHGAAQVPAELPVEAADAVVRDAESLTDGGLLRLALFRLLERDGGLLEGIAADTEPLGKFALGREPVACLQARFLDVLAQPVDQLFVQPWSLNRP